MSTHMDTLTAWFDNGETGTFTPGDVIISKNDDEYVIATISHSGTINPGEPDRILHRAPKPEPAWHNAVAVIAGYPESREAYTRTETGMWESANCLLYAHELIDPVPLIEATVTDGMVERIRELEDDYGRKYFASPIAARELLHAALNLDPA